MGAPLILPGYRLNSREFDPQNEREDCRDEVECHAVQSFLLQQSEHLRETSGHIPSSVDPPLHFKRNRSNKTTSHKKKTNDDFLLNIVGSFHFCSSIFKLKRLNFGLLLCFSVKWINLGGITCISFYSTFENSIVKAIKYVTASVHTSAFWFLISPIAIFLVVSVVAK